MPTIVGSKSGTRPYLELDWSVNSQDIANNRSSVKLKLYLKVDYSIGYSARYTGTLQGASFTSSSGYISKPGRYLLTQRDVWIGHNSDGSKTATLTADYNLNITWGGTYHGKITLSGSANLGTIPRASTMSAFSFGGHLKNGVANSIKYTVDRKSGNFRHQIQLRDGNTTIWTWDNQNTNGSNTIDLTAGNVNTLLNRMSSSTTKSFTLRIATRSGNSGGWIGSAVSRTATATVHADVKPTVGAVSLSQTGNSVSSHYLQGKSNVNAKFTRSAGYGASISSSSITVRRKSGGADSQTINSNDGTTGKAVSLSGTYEARGMAKDSRGRTTYTAWTEFTVTAYSGPKITNFTAVRSSSTPTTVDISRTTSHTVLGTSNHLSYSIQRRQGTGAWSNVNTGATGSITTSGATGSATSTGNSVTESYEFRLVVTDKFGESATATMAVSTQRVVLDIHKNEGVGIGKIHERGVLDVDGTVYMNGKIMALGGLGFEDTRTVNERPEQIPGRAFSFAFKTSSYINHPPQRAHPTYAHILNIAGWNSSEGSGGFPIQMSIGGEGISLRQGTSTTNWSNWRNLATVESGTNSNGDWYRFGNGLQVCVTTFSHNFSSSITAYVDLPLDFSNTYFAGFVGASNNYWLPAEQGSAVGHAPYSSSRSRLQRYNSANHSRGNESASYRLITIGRWK